MGDKQLIMFLVFKENNPRISPSARELQNLHFISHTLDTYKRDGRSRKRPGRTGAQSALLRDARAVQKVQDFLDTKWIQNGYTCIHVDTEKILFIK
jgi:hypothetical protein